jgi:hypothetical protein
MILEHTSTISNLDTRMTAVEQAVVELKQLAVKSDERQDRMDVDMSKIKGSFDVLLPIVYAILGVSVIAFLGMIFTFFTK